MKEIDIFEVKKGNTHGIIHVPRKYIHRKVRIVLLEKKDMNLLEHRKEMLRKVITKAQFQLDNLNELDEQRIKRRAIKNEKEMQSNNIK